VNPAAAQHLVRFAAPDHLEAVSTPQANNPLHGLTLELILRRLVHHYGFDELARLIPVNCFKFEPSITSSLKFLRRVPWARAQVEQLYVASGVWQETPGG
jgi:uncharacterized protein (DUF2132 family)